MKIAYGVCGEGNGHATRALPVIQFLRKNHELRVIAGGKAKAYLSKPVNNLVSSISFRIVYKNNGVDLFATLLYNILRLPLHIYSFFKVLFFLKKWRPDIVISDFDYITNWVAHVLAIPLISFDNEMIMTRSETEMPSGAENLFFKAKLAIHLTTPHAHKYLVTSFWNPENVSLNTTIVEPILREAVLSAKSISGNHILVYQTSNSNTQLKQDLANLPFSFIIYALDGKGWSKNCVWKKFSAKKFISDLASCQGVITNGGFTLITEALHLGKPVLSIPVQGQFEQILNAYYIQNLGYGLTSNMLTPELMFSFVKHLPEFRKNIAKYNAKKKQSWKKSLNQIIKEVAMHNN